jgi:GDP-4-dehydro-6-deoxy-D-mannose reductase
VSAFLVTGARGFIGRSLGQRLESEGHSIIGLSTTNGDISDKATLRPYRGSEIRHVFHLAARSFVPQSWSEPLEFHRVNTTGTLNVLEFCRERQISLTYVSAYLYGQPLEQPIREDHPVIPNNPYGLSKMLAEMACEFYARTHGLKVTVIRPFNVYGFGQSENFLIPTILRQIRSAHEIEVQDLAPKRDYLYIDDLIELLLATLNAPPGYNVYNGGTGSSLSVAEVIALAQAEAGTSKPVRCGQSVRTHEIRDTRADVEKARCELGWSPKYDLRDGIRTIVAMMRESE